MDAYLATRSGFLLRATGDNPTLVSTLAVMAVSGLATQAVIRRKPKEDNRHE